MNRLEETINRLIKWYPEHARDLPWRRDTEPYHVWLSEIMLQQTRVEAVKEYYKRFLNELPTVQDLARVEEERLLKLWEGLGYYNRARNLKKAAVTIVEELGGEFPDTYEGILALSGIGTYTAGAIGSICFDLQTPAVDGNVLRVYARVMEDSSNIDRTATKNKISETLAGVYPKGKCGVVTQGLMELGATVCLPNGVPRCGECPLAEICLAHENGTWKSLPVRAEKKKRKIVDKTVLVLCCGDRAAIRKRPSKGLLPDLWEFPNVDEDLTGQEAIYLAETWDTKPDRLLMSLPYTHIFTHVEWRMRAYYLDCENMCGDFVWASVRELEESFALPSAFRPFFELLAENTNEGVSL